MSFDRLRQRIEGRADYDIADLRNPVRKDESPDLSAMTRRAVEGFQFLGAMTEMERVAANENATQAREAANQLVSLVTAHTLD